MRGGTQHGRGIRTAEAFGLLEAPHRLDPALLDHRPPGRTGLAVVREIAEPTG
ncbi:hypothetical protein [Streptomyces sp. P9-A2]|uniref:hypothetical protein n=1 Tax=Streptomyces sp. P9-A2 TaxID=3072284 RepID=UPI002FCBCB56